MLASAGAVSDLCDLLTYFEIFFKFAAKRRGDDRYIFDFFFENTKRPVFSVVAGVTGVFFAVVDLNSLAWLFGMFSKRDAAGHRCDAVRSTDDEFGVDQGGCALTGSHKDRREAAGIDSFAVRDPGGGGLCFV